MIDFHDTRVLVTGATSGIGRATARLFHARGATVLATGRNPEALALDGADERWVTATGDLTAEGFRADLVALATERLGGLDVLVNAAGILEPGGTVDTDLTDWDRSFDINLRALFDLTRRAIVPLRASRGAVVKVSSVSGARAFPGLIAYCDQFTRCLALELAGDGVRVNAVNPGVVVTELHKRGGMNDQKYATFLEHSRTTHPLGRVGRPEEVAELIAFLASPAAGWITGECVAIDGGRAQTSAR